jgi:hypothetical protein
MGQNNAKTMDLRFVYGCNYGCNLGAPKKKFCQLSAGIGNFGAVSNLTNQEARIQEIRPIRRLAPKNSNF